MQLASNRRLQCEFGVADAIWSVILWVALTIVTLGLAAFVAPYYIFSEIVNKTWLVDADGHRLGQLKVNFTLTEIVGHAVIWLLLAIVTLGLALVIYYYMVLRKVLERTEVKPVAMEAQAGVHTAPATAPPAPATSRPPATRPKSPEAPQGVVRR
jgi:flagellar basal body-associated protein FliL